METLASCLVLCVVIWLCSVTRIAGDTNLKYRPNNSTISMNSKGDYNILTTLISPSMLSQLFAPRQDKERINAVTNCTVSDDAEKDIEFLITRLDQAIYYIDATAKIPDGILQGKFMWMGNYEECLSIDPLYNTARKNYFKGKYFMASIIKNGTGFLPSPANPKGVQISLGICLPDSFSSDDAKCELDKLLFLLQNSPQTPSLLKGQNITVNTTYADEEIKLDGGSITAIVISSIIVCLVLVGTFIDLVFSKVDADMTLLDGGKSFSDGSTNVVHESADYETTDRSGLLDGGMFDDSIQYERWSGVRKKLLDVFVAFSFISNAKKLLGTSTAKSPLACLNGLRVISMWWVIQGHVYAFCIYMVANPVAAVKIEKRFTFQPILNGTFSVDTFFFLSGLLVAYLALKEIKEKGKLNWVYFFLHRIWRLTPLYAFVLMIFTTLSLYMYTGPFSILSLKPLDSPFRKMIDTCKDYWWTNLLYINNFYPDYGSLGGTCMGWSWYLAIDMQCYLVISPFVIFFLHKKKFAGLSVAGGLIVVCIAIRGFVTSYYGLTGFQSQINKHTDDHWGKAGPLYQRPYTRWSVYVVGMLTGYVCNATNCRIRMNRLISLLGWAVAVASALAVIYGLYYYNSHLDPVKFTPAPMGPVASGFYISLSRTVWALCLSWLVLACVSGYGGPVNTFLSWQIWAPLGRLTYAAYLVHPIVIFVYYFNLQTLLHFSDLTMIYLFIANLVMSYAIAFIVSLAVEAPMMQLEKLVTKARAR